MPLNALRVFEVAARCGHSGLAAEELGVTSGAVSRQLKLLEQELEVTLFDRSGRQLTLNGRGARLLATMTHALDEISDGLSQLSPDSLQGSLIIACTPSMAANWLSELVVEFLRTYPEIEVHFEMIKPTQQTLPSVFDLAICFGAPVGEEYETELLYSEEFFPVISPRLLANGPLIRSPGDLLKYPLIHDRVDHWPKWLRSVGLQGNVARQNRFVQEAHLSLAGAKQGLGVALCDQLEVHHALETGELVRPLEASIPSDHAVYAVARAGRLEGIRSSVFRQWLLRELRAL